MQNIRFSDIKITGGFWKVKQDLAKNVTAKAVYDRFEETHRFSALECKWTEGQPNMPHIYWDSDVAKWIEGVAYILEQNEAPELEKICDEAIGNIVKNADENGYFNSHFLVTEQDKRFTYRSHHELYCAGHLIEAAIAYDKATGKTELLKAMCKYADYIERIFKIEDSAAFRTPGHPELELALVKLFRYTGERRYLELSKYFIDEHGNNEKDGELYKDFNLLYNQDEMPLRDRTTAEGHCVRALYLFAAMADIAEEYGDKELLDSCVRCFDNIMEKKLYITGSVGSTHIGEAFTPDYHLPARTAYTETCAAISLAMFSGRMASLIHEGKYADMVERAIYNGVLSGISMDGKAFFYENPLEIDPKFNNINTSTYTKERYPITQRVEVFDCSCCPPNMVRFIPSIADYMYSFDGDTLFVHQYMESVADTEGTSLTMLTEYPAKGKIKLMGTTDKKRVALRIPGWCRSFSVNSAFELKSGYAYIEVEGDFDLELTLHMPVQVIASNRKVHENAGRVAVQRGPVVYCAEGVDNVTDLKAVAIDIKGEFGLGENDFILPSIHTKGYLPSENEELYFVADEKFDEIPLKLIPYYAFANRGESELQVWFLRK